MARTRTERLEKRVEGFKKEKYVYTKAVDGNLYIRVNASGKKVWVYRHIEAGTKKRRWLPLGERTEINNLSVAEQKAAEYDSNLEKSGDPLIITEGDQTFSELFSLFFSKGVDRQGKPLNETTITSYVYGFNANVMPYLGKRKVKAGPLDITKGFLLKILSDCFGS